MDKIKSNLGINIYGDLVRLVDPNDPIIGFISKIPRQMIEEIYKSHIVKCIQPFTNEDKDQIKGI
jgi:hypothetical protein